jgi:hypothetical protein
MVMHPPKVQPDQYIDFLLATPKACTATEAQRVQPIRPHAPAHDAFTRLLHRLEPDPQALWLEVQPLLAIAAGVLVIDDTTLDKPYAHAIAAVTRHWSGKHQAVVQGINLISLVWTDGDRVYPCDYRVYHKAADGQTKNDHFVTLLTTARDRGFRPRCVLFDGWYASLANLKLVRDFGWTFLTRLKANRLVRWERDPARPLADQPITATGSVVWLPGYGPIRVFRLVAPNGDTTHWATNDLGLDDLTRQMLAEWSWQIEEYHRGIKQFTGIERCQARSARAQRNHIGLALRAFLRLEWHRFTTGWSWFEAKWQIVREAVRQYLECPRYRLPEPSTA